MSMMQCGIYLKYRKMANVRPAKSLHFRENVKISCKTCRRQSASFPLTHQIKCVGKKTGAAEIARFEGKNHFAFLRADRPQHRHAGRNFRADQKTGNA